MKRESRRPGKEGDGSGVSDCSRRPESIKTSPDEQRLDPIDVYCAGESDAVRALRRSINRCNADAARRAKAASSDDARALFWTAAQIAGAWTFRPASETSLRAARNALRWLYQTAHILAWLETPGA